MHYDMNLGKKNSDTLGFSTVCISSKIKKVAVEGVVVVINENGKFNYLLLV